MDEQTYNDNKLRFVLALREQKKAVPKIENPLPFVEHKLRLRELPEERTTATAHDELQAALLLAEHANFNNNNNNNDDDDDDNDKAESAPMLANVVTEKSPVAVEADSSRLLTDELRAAAGCDKGSGWITLDTKLELRHRKVAMLSVHERLWYERRTTLRTGNNRDDVADEMAAYSSSSTTIDEQTGKTIYAKENKNAGGFGLQFELLTEPELLGISQGRIYSVAEWDARAEVNAPNEAGLLDERMGPLDRSVYLGGNRTAPAQCLTCAGLHHRDAHTAAKPGESGDCPGHFMHIQTPGAVYNPTLVSYARHILASFCWHCGKLPGNEKRNSAVIDEMRATCKDKFEKLLFLSAKYGKDKYCVQCTKSRRCAACNGADKQCEECTRFVCFRPLVRTLRQMENDGKRQRAQFDKEHEDVDVDEDDDADVNRRDALRRGEEYMGFPYKAFLDGNAGCDTTLYQQFARAVGYSETANMLVLHGERIREIIQQMHCSFLQLFFDSTYDTFRSVLAWFRAFVPRHVPVAPNAICPTSVGDDQADHNLSDTRRCYRMFLRYVVKVQTMLDPAIKSCPSLNTCFYNTGRARNTDETLPDAHGYFSGDNEHESPRNYWFKVDPRRDIYYIEAYGEMQYYYSRIIAADLAAFFLPSHLRKRKFGGKQKSATIEAAVGNAGTGGGPAATNSFKERLRGKGGRFRGNLGGKRVDFSTRTVITPDPRLGIGQVGVPRATLCRFFERERVFALNVVSLAITGERLRNGWTRGVQRANCKNTAAEEILYTDSRTECCLFNAANDDRQRVTSDLAGARVLGQPIYDHGFMSEAGAALERPLREGDFIIMNRQPTLHEQGMMAEEVVAFDNDARNMTMDARFNRPVDSIPKTLRKAVQSTTPYNADFDGDEMNGHLASGSLMARAEVETLMKVSDKLISTRDMAPTCGAKQDSGTGIYMLTARDTFLTYEQACQLMLAAQQNYCTSDYNRQTYKLACRLPQPAITHFERNNKGRITKSIPLWTGAQIVGIALPEKLNYHIGKLSSEANLDYPKAPPLKKNATPQERAEYEKERQKIKIGVDLPLLIVDGELMYGRFDKRSCGDKHGAITQAIIRRVLAVVDGDDTKSTKPDDNNKEFAEFIETFDKMSLAQRSHSHLMQEIDRNSNDKQKHTWRHANRDRSRQEACAFIDRCGWLATEFLDQVGLSVGIGDCMLPSDHEVYRKVAEINERCEREIAQVVGDKRYAIMIGEVNRELARTGDAPVPWKPSYKITRGGNYSDRVSEIERVILGLQGNAFQQIMDAVNKNLPYYNSFPKMLYSGGKGKLENAPSIIGAVGGQQLEGRRVIDRFTGQINLSQTNSASGVDRKRDANECETTAPYFMFRSAVQMTRETTDPPISMRSLDNLFARLSPHIPLGVYPSAEEGGYIDNSYLKGLTPLQMWRHAQAAREGLCDTAIKTSETGSEQRLAMKSCEDVSICYDSTIRSCTNELVSFRYGDTGYDPKKLEKKSLEIVGARLDVVREQLFYRSQDDCLIYASKRDLTSLRVERARIDKAIELARAALCEANESTRIITPGNLESTILEVMAYFGHSISNVMWFDENSARNTRWHYTPQHDREYAARFSEYDRDMEIFKRYSNYNEFVKYQTTQFAVLGRLTEGEASRLVDAAVRKWRGAGVCDAITECEFRLRLCSKQVTRRYQMSRQCLVAILATYERTLFDAMAPPGEAVGALMVTSVGQPSTQMTLNTFHLTGKSNVGVISGLPRMQEISHVVITAKMKGLKVVIALHDGSFIFAMGQRSVVQRLLCRLLLAGPRQPTMTVRARQIEQQLVTVRRQTAELAIVAAAQNATMVVVRHSRFSDGSTPLRQTAAKKVAALTLLGAIRNLTGTKDVPSTIQCLLSECCVDWSTQKPDALAGLRLPALSAGVVRPESVLVVHVETQFLTQRNTTMPLLCESIWRALLPFIGAEARHVVQEIAAVGGRNRIAIAVLGCDESARQKFYLTIRRDRHTICVDLLGNSDLASTTMFQQECLAKSPPTPVTMTGEQLHDSNASTLRNASARGLLKNMISTHVVDVTESFAILYQPLRYDPTTQTITTEFEKASSTSAHHQTDEQMLIADESERMMCSLFYGNRRSVRQMHCQREDCVMSRVDAADPRHAEAQCGCQSNYVIVMRLDRRWFENNKMPPEQLRRSLARELGKHFCVLIGDINSDNYIALHVRLRTCALDEVIKELNANRFKDVSNFGLIGTKEEMDEAADEETLAADNAAAAATEAPVANEADEPEDDIDEFVEPEPQRRISNEAIAAARATSQRRLLATDSDLAILDSVVYLILNHSMCGPVRGTAVMFDEDARQIYMPESGMETCTRMTIACNSSEFNFLLGLRGVDPRYSRSNSVHDVCDVYGIEAGREAIISEYAEVLRDGSYVNRSHLAIRADVQTRQGCLVPLTADGLRANNHDVIQSATHRENTETVVDAALRGKSTYPLVSPSACVALGAPIRSIGTGIVTIVQKNEQNESAYAALPMEPGDVLLMNKDYILQSLEKSERMQMLDDIDHSKSKLYGTDYLPNRVVGAIENGTEAIREAWRQVLEDKHASMPPLPTAPVSAPPVVPSAMQTPIGTVPPANAHNSALPLVINGIALDKLSKDIAAKIYDNVALNRHIEPTTEKYPHGFHPALLGGNDDDDDDDSEKNCTAAFSPMHDDDPDDLRRQTSAATAAALATVQHDLKTMSSPSDELKRMEQRAVATKKQSGVAPFDAADAFDDVQKQFEAVGIDEFAESNVRSPAHGDTVAETANESLSASDSSDTESSTADDDDDDTTSVSSNASSSASYRDNNDTTDRGPRVIEHDVQPGYQSPPFFTPPHDRDVDKKTLQMAELRRQAQFSHDQSHDRDKKMADEVASTAVPLVSKSSRNSQDRARYSADLKTKQFRSSPSSTLPQQPRQPFVPPQHAPFQNTARMLSQSRAFAQQQQQQHQNQQEYYRQQYLQQQQRQRDSQHRQSSRERNRPIWPQTRPHSSSNYNRQQAKTNFGFSTSSGPQHRQESKKSSLSQTNVDEYDPDRPGMETTRTTIQHQQQPDEYDPEKPGYNNNSIAATEKSPAAKKSTVAEKSTAAATPAAALAVSIVESRCATKTTQTANAFSSLDSHLTYAQRQQQPSTDAAAAALQAAAEFAAAAVQKQRELERKMLQMDVDTVAIYDDEDEANLYATDFMGRSKTLNIFNK